MNTQKILDQIRTRVVENASDLEALTENLGAPPHRDVMRTAAILAFLESVAQSAAEMKLEVDCDQVVLTTVGKSGEVIMEVRAGSLVGCIKKLFAQNPRFSEALRN